ncbi:MAG: hypothetical protein EXS31_17750 [Pedosphaera sp.]|nr:hypothetical protein [Pedosphaera sp.]
MHPASSLWLQFVFIIAAMVLSAPQHSMGAASLTVEAGSVSRRASIVTTILPTSLRGIQYLRTADGKTIPIQVSEDGEAAFILEELGSGKSARLELFPASPEAHAGTGIQTTREGRKLKLNSAGRSIIEYQADPAELPRPDLTQIYQRGGYLHPIFSPSGRPVTDDYPSNHKHHHGIWFPWTKTEFEGRHPDFWNMGDGLGRVEFVAMDKHWSGSVHGGFRARHRFIDLTGETPKAALNEEWEVRAYNPGRLSGGRPCHVFDLVSTQQCAGPGALKLPQYHYGGLGIRGHGDWNGESNAFFLTSEGETNRLKGNETRGRWCHIGGVVEGMRTGIAILCHPGNFRAPQPMRLHPGEPFFCFAPQQLGEFEITPGKPYISRYRFVAFDGLPDRAELDQAWNDYAQPANVTLDLR